MTTLTPRPGSESSFGTDPGDPSNARFIGGVGERLTSEQVRGFVIAALATADLDGKRVCLVVPDGTRTCPLPLLMRSRWCAVKPIFSFMAPAPLRHL